MTDHAAMAPRTEDRLPLWGRLLLLIAAPGSLYLVGRLVYEQTIATWQNGPLMIGFGLVHGNVFFPLLASIVLLAFWTLVVALRSIWVLTRHRRVPAGRWVLLFALACFLSTMFISYGAWQRIFASQVARSPMSVELFTYAAARGDLPTVKALLARGLDVNAQNKGGGTALFVAAAEGYQPIVEYLLSKGADTNTLTLEGKSALSMARERNHGEIVTLLREHGAQEPRSTEP